MRDETGERCSLDEVLREVLEHLMDSRGENRVKLTQEMVPTEFRAIFEKSHMEKLIYKSRYENIEEWGGLMSHFSAASLRALAASKCIPRGMTPTFEAIQRHWKKRTETLFQCPEYSERSESGCNSISR